MTEVVLLVLIIVTGTGGELCLAHAMKGVGEVADFRPSGLLHTLVAALADGWLWLGIGLLIIDLAALLAMLSVENVSFVIPMTALSYVVGAAGGTFFLGERVDRQRWIGVLLVCGGEPIYVRRFPPNSDCATKLGGFTHNRLTTTDCVARITRSR